MSRKEVCTEVASGIGVVLISFWLGVVLYVCLT
jgi:hypothetical protein